MRLFGAAAQGCALPAHSADHGQKRELGGVTITWGLDLIGPITEGRVLINRFGRRPLAMSAIPQIAKASCTLSSIELAAVEDPFVQPVTALTRLSDRS